MIVIIAAVIAVVIFIGMSIFQLLLALGLPYGKAAYGGKHETLPKNLRIMSVIAIGIFVLASISVLIRSGILPIFTDSIFFVIVVWVFAFYSALNTLMNLASKSKTEKRIMTPLSLTITICCFTIAIFS